LKSGLAGRSGRAGRSGFFHAGLGVKGRSALVPAGLGRVEPVRGRSYAGRPAAGRLVAGRASPVEPSAKRAGGRTGRSSFFHADRAAERAAGRESGRSKLRPAGRLKPKLVVEPVPVRLGRSSSVREKLRTGLGAEVRPAEGRKPSAPGRAGRKNLLASPLAKESAARAGRAEPNFFVRESLGRAARSGGWANGVATRGRLLGLGRTVGKRPASSRLRRRSSLDLGVRSLPSAVSRSAANSSGCSSRRLPGS
jgi:hypothetical protein